MMAGKHHGSNAMNHQLNAVSKKPWDSPVRWMPSPLNGNLVRFCHTNFLLCYPTYVALFPTLIKKVLFSFLYHFHLIEVSCYLTVT